MLYLLYALCNLMIMLILNIRILGVGGRLGVGSSFSAYVRKITALEKVENMEDPREAVLKYAKVYCIICIYV